MILLCLPLAAWFPMAQSRRRKLLGLAGKRNIKLTLLFGVVAGVLQFCFDLVALASPVMLQVHIIYIYKYNCVCEELSR